MRISSVTPNPGDVVTLSFNYLDGTGSKIRPAVALSRWDYNESRRYFVFTPITGSPGHGEDVVEIRDLPQAGLNRRSYSHGMLFSAVTRDIIRIAGHLSAPDLARVRDLVKRTLIL
jgi:mRNA-degrading endonuclease toxin of MazEF toxin-antitoxin module